MTVLTLAVLKSSTPLPSMSEMDPAGTKNSWPLYSAVRLAVQLFCRKVRVREALVGLWYT